MKLKLSLGILPEFKCSRTLVNRISLILNRSNSGDLPAIRYYVKKLKQAKKDFEDCQRLCGDTNKGELYELEDIKKHWQLAYDDLCKACRDSCRNPSLQSYTQLWNDLRLDILKNSLMVEKQVSVLNWRYFNTLSLLFNSL